MVDFGRLLHLPDAKGYRVELERRVARVGLAPLSADESRAIATAYRLKNDASVKVATTVVAAIAGGLSLADFEAGIAAQLRDFAMSIGVARSTIDDAVETGAKAAFSKWAASVVASGHIEDADFERMRSVGGALGLDEEMQNQLYGAAARPAVLGLVDDALTSDSLSPEEDARLLRTISEKFRITADFSGEIWQRLEHARASWAISNGPLPIVEVPLSLQRNEAAHTVASATAYQTATRTKSVGYAGPALRVRIAKGLYYRTGQYRVHRQTEQYEKTFGHGSLVVTNKRLLFITGNGTSSARLDSILHIEPFTDALGVVRSSGKPTTYRFDTADEWFCAILARAIHDATAG